MTRRKSLVVAGALITAPALRAQFSQAELQNDFMRRANSFIKQWNLAMNMIIDGRWDVKVGDETVKCFQTLIDHPMWLRKKKG